MSKFEIRFVRDLVVYFFIILVISGCGPSFWTKNFEKPTLADLSKEDLETWENCKKKAEKAWWAEENRMRTFALVMLPFAWWHPGTWGVLVEGDEEDRKRRNEAYTAEINKCFWKQHEDLRHK